VWDSIGNTQKGPGSGCGTIILAVLGLAVGTMIFLWLESTGHADGAFRLLKDIGSAVLSVLDELWKEPEK